jgi:hypothetical protein
MELQVCGAPCSNYCFLQTHVCGFKEDAAQFAVYQTYDDCDGACQGYAQLVPFNANGSDDDSFECRLRYLLNAAIATTDLDKGNACAASGPQSVPCDNM